ncbi:phosphogluconate dehydrogenase C-terminal domain-containing protein [Microbacterium alcoholitolerans]|uniref:phosphogluconate dehydrogenase C-terminal domain-containing protein n=1 Tax=unclassified Microbacterium TaxID=2609290 RepID=UPI003D168330
MTSIAIIGAGGKMGFRTSANLQETDYTVSHVEPSEQGRARLTTLGIHAVDVADAVPGADVVILTVPDNRIGRVSKEIVPQMQTGATLVVLDAAAPYAGEIALRDDISAVACHPCHPPVFSDEVEAEAQQDYFGGVAAKQDVVIALISGTDADYDRAEPVVRAMFAPVRDAYRITVDNMVLLEPVLAETTAATCVTIIREATDEAISRGVPADAAFAFILGHLRVELAILFDQIGSPFSDGAIKAIESARDILFRPDWKRVFDEENVRASVAEIVAE